METAIDMSKKICKFSLSSYGIGVTGKLGRVDENNLFGDDAEVVDYMLHLKVFIDTDEKLDGLVSFYQDQLANG